jgi:hypothetical protein
VRQVKTGDQVNRLIVVLILENLRVEVENLQALRDTKSWGFKIIDIV